MAERLDIVCPVYNERQSLPGLFAAVAESVKPLKMAWRIILVDDGSSDGSWELMRELAAARKNVTALELSRNYGQHVAVSAGLDFSDADYVVVMDADLQDPPGEIPRMVEKLRRGECDIVYTCRSWRGDSLWRRIGSWTFWRLIRLLAGQQIVPNQLMLRAMNRSFVRAFTSLRERHRVVAGLSAWLGFKAACLEVKGGVRRHGQSKYNLRGLLSVAVDATTSLSIIPLRFASVAGFIITVLAFLYGGYVLARALFFGGYLSGFPSLVVLITGLSGVQLMILGLLGEYLGRTLRETQGRPLYLVRQVKGQGEREAARHLPLAPPRGGG